jgi:outer membrane protein OmpA-like peptidoglycan-associated protein
MNAPFEKIFSTLRRQKRVRTPQTPPFRRKLLLEFLEPRLLLSADIASPAAVDFLASHEGEPQSASAVIRTSEPAAPIIVNAELSDSAQVAASSPGPESGFVQLDQWVPDTADLTSLTDPNAVSELVTEPPAACTTLYGGPENTVWDITGPDSGLVNGQPFSGVSNLIGAAGNEDTFVVYPGGSISGIVDGGSGGFDTLLIDGGSFGAADFVASGPDSGVVVLDGKAIQYRGLEPIVDNSDTTDRVITASPGDDLISITQDASGQITVASQNGTFERVLFSAPTNSLTINAGDGNDTITLDLLGTGPGITVTIEGGAGTDTLVGPANDTTWTITGPDAGTVGGMSFTGVENLTGAAGNRDTFVFEEAGSITGLIDGGAGGFDTLVIDGGQYANAVFAASGPDSGTVTLDANLIRYQGLEPIIDNANIADRSFTGTTGTDHIVVKSTAAGQLTVESQSGTFESITFGNPTISLTIDAAGGDDTITAESLGTYAGTLNIVGGAGTDTFNDLIGIAPASLNVTDVELLPQGIPNWTQQGPGGITGGQTVTPPSNLVAGAVRSIAVDPANPDVTFLGTVNGGVWRKIQGSETVHFATGSADLFNPAPAFAATRLQNQTVLDDLVTFLSGYPNVKLTVTGNTDSSGTDAVNLTLSTQRADAVVTYLSTHGIATDRLTAIGLGSTFPVGDNTTVAGAAMNRRVDMVFDELDPLTDQLPSLAIGDLILSPLDADGVAVTRATPLNKLVIYAGTGNFSSFGNEGGLPVGLLVSRDGGSTWNLNAAPQLAGLSVTSVVATTLTVGGKQVVLVSTLDKETLSVDNNGVQRFNSDGSQKRDLVKEGGIFRSEDGGLNFTKVSGVNGNPDGEVSELVADPADPSSFYAAVIGHGIVRSTDGGQTWTDAVTQPAGINDASRVDLSVSAAVDGDTGNHPLYAAIVRNTARLTANVDLVNTPNQIQVDSTGIFQVGDQVWVANVDVTPSGNFNFANWEINPTPNTAFTITAINTGTNTLTLSANLANAHAAGRLVRVIDSASGAYKTRLSGVFRTDDLGTTWQNLAFPLTTDNLVQTGIHPGGQGDLHLSLLADSTNPDVVYIGGDRQPTLTGNAAGFTGSQFVGRLFAGTFNEGAGTTAWQQIVGTNVGGTAPHADSRDMVFSGGNILESDDGGLYRLVDPAGTAFLAGGPNLTFNAAARTIQRSAGDWTTDSFVIGQRISIVGSNQNDGIYTIAGFRQTTTPNDTLLLSAADPTSIKDEVNVTGRVAVSSRFWESLGSGLAVNEFYSVAYDPTNTLRIQASVILIGWSSTASTTMRTA